MGHRGERAKHQGEVESQHGGTLPASTQPQQDRLEAACGVLPGRLLATPWASYRSLIVGQILCYGDRVTLRLWREVTCSYF